MHTLYLIDSSIYVFRAWHMLPGSITSAAGEPANAVYGFSEFLLKLIETETPSHMVCAFDQNSDGCARRRIYPDYKANRPAAPEDLKKQFAWAREFAEALGLPCFASHSLEADDIIGTLANRARAQQARSIILSADKDLAQFVGKDDMIWDYARNRRQTIADIRKRYRINPGQIPDMLALAGDAVDNIPGVPGIGIHTAARLLIKWGDLDTLYANLDAVATMKFRGAPRVAQLVAEHRNTVYLCRRLTGLFHDDSLPDKLENLAIKPADSGRLEDLYQRFAFSAQRRARWEKILGTSRHALAPNQPR